jgi:hypothetical protein
LTVDRQEKQVVGENGAASERTTGRTSSGRGSDGLGWPESGPERHRPLERLGWPDEAGEIEETSDSEHDR